MSLLQLANLSKTFNTPQGPVHAVRDVTLAAQQGECLAIVGESGSGKTTIANMVLGLFAPTAGVLTFDGNELPHKRTKDHRRAIQLVQQNPLSSLNPKRSVGASVRLGLDTYGIGAASDRWGMVEAALEAVGLPAEMRKTCGVGRTDLGTGCTGTGPCTEVVKRATRATWFNLYLHHPRFGRCA